MFWAFICPSSGARDYTCVIAAYGVWCLGCWCSAVRSRAAGYVSGVREVVHNFPHPGHIACCSTPNDRTPATKASHTICGNNTSIVSSSWWWAYEFPKHVERILIAIKHSVASSWFSSLRLYYDAWTNIHQIYIPMFTKDHCVTTLSHWVLSTPAHLVFPTSTVVCCPDTPNSFLWLQSLGQLETDILYSSFIPRVTHGLSIAYFLVQTLQ